LSEDTFIFKAQRYNGRATCVPLVAIHVADGFQVLPGTDSAEKWLEDSPAVGDGWIPFDPKCLLREIENCA
jgi:hypothetical protein